MALFKNPGPLLTSEFFGDADLIPAKYRAKIGTRKKVQNVPVDIPPDPLVGDLVQSWCAQERTDERTKVNIELLGPITGSLTEEVMLPSGLVGTQVCSVVPEGDPLDVNAYTIKASQDNWGNGFMEECILSTPSIFHENMYQRERPDVTPEVFKALLQTYEESYFENGIAVDPYPLADGYLKEQQKQEDVFHRRVDKVYLPLIDLPKQVIDRKTNRFKQTVYDKKILDLASVVPPGPSSVQDSEWTHLGNGTAVAELQYTDDLFPNPIYSKSIENLIPPKFRAQIPVKTNEYTTDDPINVDPPLATGELTHEEQQVDVYNKRVKSVFFNVTIPPNVVFTDEETSEEFGGGVLDVIMTLAVSGTLTIDTGKRVTQSEISDLGNGYEIRITKQLQDTNWPALQGQDYDDRFDVVLPFTQQVIDANTGIGTVRTDIKPIDRWREQTRTVDITAIQDILDVYVLTYPSKVNVDLPDKLVSAEGVEDSTYGEGTNEETGDFDPGTGSYSVSLSLRASAQSSAALLFDIKSVIKQFWGNNIPCIEAHFFLPSPVTPADVLARLTAIFGAISAWPKFSPEMVVFSIKGQRVSLQATASSQGSASASTSGAYTTTGGGTGHSKEVGLNLKVVRISPTIHGSISLTGDTTDSIMISADAHANATGLGPDETEHQEATVTGSIEPTTIPATSGATDWPTTGKYLYKTDAQPYRFGYVQFHCVVVDAADFPT